MSSVSRPSKLMKKGGVGKLASLQLVSEESAVFRTVPFNFTVGQTPQRGTLHGTETFAACQPRKEHVSPGMLAQSGS